MIDKVKYAGHLLDCLKEDYDIISIDTFLKMVHVCSPEYLMKISNSRIYSKTRPSSELPYEVYVMVDDYKFFSVLTAQEFLEFENSPAATRLY